MTMQELENVWTILQQIAAANNTTPEEVRKEITAALDAAWNNPVGLTTRHLLFPNGKPTPEAFILRIAKEI